MAAIFLHIAGVGARQFLAGFTYTQRIAAVCPVIACIGAGIYPCSGTANDQAAKTTAIVCCCTGSRRFTFGRSVFDFIGGTKLQSFFIFSFLVGECNEAKKSVWCACQFFDIISLLCVIGSGSYAKLADSVTARESIITIETDILGRILLVRRIFSAMGILYQRSYFAQG